MEFRFKAWGAYADRYDRATDQKNYIYYCLPIITSFGIGQLKESDFGAETV